MRHLAPVIVLLAAAPLLGAERAVEFNRDVRPILSDKCYLCHGPDAKAKNIPLRLDSEAAAKADLGGGRRPIVESDPDASQMIRRITASDLAVRMPPAFSGLKLTATEIDTLRTWIAQGAKWQKHWAYLPPVRPPLPDVKNKAWPRNPIDSFVLSRLESEGLQPSAEASPETLLRRASLDLTGLPPTPAEIDAFLKDKSPNAYEKAVDRLLVSPRYGERMAARWLDAARYADSSGYEYDGERQMWRWRDWVIDAFNRNQPYDQFTLEQIAGDLLPNATLEQKIATGFNRNHRANSEGGIIPEEYAVEYVVDRVETTSTVFLGLTLGCARCHDHKYDPFTQKDFYSIFAYFDNVPERGRAMKYGNSPPLVPAPTTDQQAALDRLNRSIQKIEDLLRERGPALERSQQAWTHEVANAAQVYWSPTSGLEAAFPLESPGEAKAASGSAAEASATKATAEKAATASTAKAGGEPPRKAAGELVEKPAASQTIAKAPDASVPFVPGRLGKAAYFDGKTYLDAGDIAGFDIEDRFTLCAWVYSESTPDGSVISKMRDAPRGRGYGVYLNQGKVHVHLTSNYADDAIRMETEEALAPRRWYHVAVTYTGSRMAEGVHVYLDGKPVKTKVLLDALYRPFRNAGAAFKDPFRIGGGGGPDHRFHGQIDDVRIYARTLNPEEISALAVGEPINAIARKSPAERSDAERAQLRWYFLENAAGAEVQDSWKRLTALYREREKLERAFPTVMVMAERPVPKETHLLIRGAYDKPGEKVEPGVPTILAPLPVGAPNNRLGFARWLVDSSNPLTARVAVNRFWQMSFGTGLVKTAEDFGVQSEWPSHPELLDWLATEFTRCGWDMKALRKLIVTSAAYRQSSRATPELLQRDPDNRLLARGPRYRLPAEAIRDQALYVAGLLVEKQGGPSVKPYQPAGLWTEISMQGLDYEQSHGPDLYRRGLYTFWKRTIAPPMMLNFDAANHESCTVRENRTNTPLQALDLMNDVTFLEAARFLGQRMIKEGGDNPVTRLHYGFRLATGRWPSAAEEQVLRNNLQFHLDYFASNPDRIKEYLSQGESPADPAIEPRLLAGYAAVGSMLLNLDETITKQ